MSDSEKKYYIDGPVTIKLVKSTPQKAFSNPYYTVEPIMKRVTRAEFEAWIKAYPRDLDVDVYGACDPPAVSYNDFSLADRWPHSIVARTYAYDEKPGSYYYFPEEQRHYYVMVNYEEVFASKTEYMADHSGGDPFIAGTLTISVPSNEKGEIVAEFHDVKTFTFDVFANSQVDGGERDA